MKTYLVTGAIGSGKSEVCRYLAAKGWPVYDCDSRTKMLYSTVPGLKCRIEEALGVPFDKLGVIFKDDRKRQELESIVYPYLLEDIRCWKSGLDSRLAFIESAIALDKPVFDDEYDGVILVSADYSARLERNPKVAERDALQTFDDNRTDFKIENNSTLRALHVRVGKLLRKI